MFGSEVWYARMKLFLLSSGIHLVASVIIASQPSSAVTDNFIIQPWSVDKFYEWFVIAFRAR